MVDTPMGATTGPHYVERDGGPRLAYLDQGNPAGHCLVLLHSLGTDHHIWDEILARFAGSHRLVAPDYRGHGRSGRGAGASVPDLVADLDVVLRAARAPKATLVGVSLGGIVALAYAAGHPERVEALVVADSFAELPAEVAGARIADLTGLARTLPMEQVADRYVADTFESPPPAGAARVRSALAAMDPADYIEAVRACFTARVSGCLPRIAVPTLVLWGDRDRKTPRELSERIAAGVPGARLAEVPGAGHLSNVDNPQAFGDLLDAFLAAGRPACAPPSGHGRT